MPTVSIYYTVGDPDTITIDSGTTYTTGSQLYFCGDDGMSEYWREWCNISISTTSCTTSNIIWTTWSDTTSCTSTSPYIVQHTPTAEEVEQLRIETAAHIARRKEREAKQRVADDRAEALLIGHLTHEQLQQFKAERQFVVEGRSGRRYRIRRGRTANVDVVDRAGKITHRLCAHPASEVPDYDNMLVQKLMIEDDESMFERIANRHPAMQRDTVILPALQ